MKYVICSVFFLIIIGGCSTSAWQEGMRMQQEQQCYEMDGQAQVDCLESVDYTVEEYEKERKQMSK